VILDCVGAGDRTRALQWLRNGGRVVTLRGDGFHLSDEKGLLFGLPAAALQLGGEKLVLWGGYGGASFDWGLFQPDGKVLREIAEMMESGLIRSIVDENSENFQSLKDTAAAYQLHSSGKFSGKIVVSVQ
jgi:NADPH:quinone reductase-like Zn-dependent oxidoreductase